MKTVLRRLLFVFQCVGVFYNGVIFLVFDIFGVFEVAVFINLFFANYIDTDGSSKGQIEKYQKKAQPQPPGSC